MDIIRQFLESEIMDLEIYKVIHDFIALDNFRYGVYEGNQYMIRKVNNNHIQIEDYVAVCNTGVPHVEIYNRGKLLHVLEMYKNTF
ncbi:hypothetical protein NSQ77_09885 [Oceanobacillus sp. FSL K6-2867]|uniref:hypothetical protein n=1 Tax=Oceanobacillus sp. FSL K6-2867 TaxID=2954748 RepID=UPI0030D6D576